MGAALFERLLRQVAACAIATMACSPPPLPEFSELWYSVDDRLVYMAIDPRDGGVLSVVDSRMVPAPPLGQNMLTVLPDGSLLGGRLLERVGTYLYHVAVPPRDGTPAQVSELGMMIEDIKLEALYTDCEGVVFAMDTGRNSGNEIGNRLLRFTGDVRTGDFSYEPVSDLSSAIVADIDDLGPGIADGRLTDNPGLAIDSGTIYTFDYVTGTGAEVGRGGRWGIHALGAAVFDDGVARAYVLSADGALYQLDAVAFEISGPLASGPDDVAGQSGWSGLAGPLTDCDHRGVSDK